MIALTRNISATTAHELVTIRTCFTTLNFVCYSSRAWVFCMSPNSFFVSLAAILFIQSLFSASVAPISPASLTPPPFTVNSVSVHTAHSARTGNYLKSMHFACESAHISLLIFVFKFKCLVSVSFSFTSLTPRVLSHMHGFQILFRHPYI